MDGSRFDNLTRSINTAGSRRRALRGLLVGALGLLVSQANDASARKKPCSPCKKRKKGKCKGKKPDGTACPGGTCHGGRCVEPACGAGGPCRVFVTSSKHTGNLGGLSGADAVCQGLAAAASLPGTYKAWLSDPTSSPSARFVPSPGPYQLVNGTTIAANWADLTDGTLAAPISVTETGGAVGPSDVAWTSTKTDGTLNTLDRLDRHCEKWSTSATTKTGLIAVPTESSGIWTEALAEADCSNLEHFYCFQQS